MTPQRVDPHREAEARRGSVDSPFVFSLLQSNLHRQPRSETLRSHNPMSFAVTFYSFTIELNNLDRDFSGRVRFKEPRHPNETPELLHARVISYMHCYRPEQVFGGGLFRPNEPTISASDVTGQLEMWTYVGVPTEKNLHKALRATGHGPAAQVPEVRVYFYEPEQIDEFCTMLRGSKTNWVEPVKFFLIDAVFLAQLVEFENTSSSWSATIVEDTLYLELQETEFASSIQPVDIWQEFQRTIQVHA